MKSSSDKLAKTLEISDLFRIYKDLLTAKQIQYLSLYIDEDWSLQEIAQNYAVSRNAVHDAIQKTILILENFEAKLHLLAKTQKLQKLIQSHEKSPSTEVQAILKVLITEV